MIFFVYLYMVLRHWYFNGKVPLSPFTNMLTNFSKSYWSFNSLFSLKNYWSLQSFSSNHRILITMIGCVWISCPSEPIYARSLSTNASLTGKFSLKSPIMNKAISCYCMTEIFPKAISQKISTYLIEEYCIRKICTLGDASSVSPA